MKIKAESGFIKAYNDKNELERMLSIAGLSARRVHRPDTEQEGTCISSAYDSFVAWGYTIEELNEEISSCYVAENAMERIAMIKQAVLDIAKI